MCIKFTVCWIVLCFPNRSQAQSTCPNLTSSQLSPAEVDFPRSFHVPAVTPFPVVWTKKMLIKPFFLFCGKWVHAAGLWMEEDMLQSLSAMVVQCVTETGLSIR